MSPNLTRGSQRQQELSPGELAKVRAEGEQAPAKSYPEQFDDPPRDTPNGAQGRRYVREQLATARTLVVNTRKYDIHRRYVAHVFYAFNNGGIEHTFLKGRYLNQELVDKGFAKVV